MLCVAILKHSASVRGPLWDVFNSVSRQSSLRSVAWAQLSAWSDYWLVFCFVLFCFLFLFLFSFFFFFIDFGLSLWSRTKYIRTLWSWTIYNLGEYSKLNNYALGTYLNNTGLLLQGHIANMLLETCEFSNNGPGAYLTSKIHSDYARSWTIRS